MNSGRAISIVSLYMPIGRILRYGIIYWLVGAVLTLIEVQANLSRGALTVIFYVASVVLPLIFFGIYFHRAPSTPSWRDALPVGIAWIILFIILDLIFFILLFRISVSTYLSVETLIGFILILVIGMGVGALSGKTTRTRRPEGLA